MARQAVKTDGLTERGRYWKDLLAEQDVSGLTQTAFCRQRGVNAATFSWWKNWLRHSGHGPGGRRSGPLAAGSGQAPVAFREMAVPAGLAGPAGYEVLLGSGRTLRVPAGFNEADLRRLLSVLEAAC